MRDTNLLTGRLADLEGGAQTFLFPSGTSAIFAALFLFGRQQVLIARNCYPPTLRIARELAMRTGMELVTFDPTDVVGLSARLSERTGAVFADSIASWTFEFVDVRALADACHSADVPLIVDNTIATPLYFKPLCSGADIVIESLSKYLSGPHATTAGAIVTGARPAELFEDKLPLLGIENGEFPESSALCVLRGLDTLESRLDRAQRSTFRFLDYLKSSAKIADIYHPSLERGRAVTQGNWRRTGRPAEKSGLAGFTSLLSVTFSPEHGSPPVQRHLDNLRVFESGFGWGGAVSRLLLLPDKYRRLRSDLPSEPLLRIYLGHESTDRLIEDFSTMEV